MIAGIILTAITTAIGKAVYDTRQTPEELNRINRTDELCHATGNEN